MILFFLSTWAQATLLASGNTASLSVKSTLGEEKKFTISGYVKDGNNGEELVGVSIYNPEAQTGTTTNLYGY